MARPALVMAKSHSVGAERIVTDEYILLPGDLREADTVTEDLKKCGLRSSIPTLILAECVLVYMPPEDSQALVSKLGAWLPSAAFLVYEQVRTQS